MSHENLDKVKAVFKLSSVAGKYMKLENRGNGEWLGLCPFHSENTPSFTISDPKRFFHCFGCGERGDLFDLMQHFTGANIPQIKEMLTGETMVFHDIESQISEFQTKAFYDELEDSEEFLPMIIDYLPRPDIFNHSQLGSPVYIWKYTNEQGQRLCYVCRFSGKKFRTKSLWKGQESFKEIWQWKSLPAPRPLYGLWKLTERPLAPVVMCEGEKDADAAQKILPDVITMAWPNGASSIKQCDWSPLDGREVIMWPDADDPGLKASVTLGERLNGLVRSFNVFTPPSGVVKGWGAADALAEGWPIVLA